MAEEFPCPHCGHKYPRSEKLVDRPVRCRECKENFVLRADGNVDKVGGVRASQETNVSSLLRQATSQATTAAAAAVGGGRAVAGGGASARSTPPSTDPDRFPCPHCGELYPRDDKLIDRPVRCRACRDSFVLRADGRAEPVGTTRVERGGGTAGSVSSIEMPRPPKLDPEPSSTSSARAEFACPHCGVTFPMREDLVGKRSHCTSCTGEFELSPDGSAWIPPGAEKIDAEAQLAKRRPPSTDEGPSSPRPAAVSGNESRREKQEELRKQMSKRLQDSVQAAVQSTAVKRESRRLERQSGKSDRKGTTRAVRGSTKRTKRGSDDQIETSAVLTGEGKRAGKRWLIVQLVVVAVALPAVLWFVFSLDFSPERVALEAFVEPADNHEDWKWPRRTETMLSRAWLHDPRMPLIQNFDGAGFYRFQSVDLAPLRELMAKYQVLPGTPLLIPVDQVDEARAALVDVGGDLEEIKFVLREEGYQVIGRGELIDLLPSDAYDQRERAILRRLVTGQTHRSGTNLIFRRFLKGEFPDRIELSFFAGTGYRLQSANGEYDRHSVRYEGYLMRFVGGDWRPLVSREDDPAEGWRIFAIQAVHPKDKLPGGDIW